MRAGLERRGRRPLQQPPGSSPLRRRRRLVEGEGEGPRGCGEDRARVPGRQDPRRPPRRRKVRPQVRGVPVPVHVHVHVHVLACMHAGAHDEGTTYNLNLIK